MSTAFCPQPTFTASHSASAKHVYQLMRQEPLAHESRAAAEIFLQEQLQQTTCLPSPMPRAPAELDDWVCRSAVETGEAYSRYLESRKAGQGRRYFKSRSQALSFLQRMAPTKLVDGAWLYGVLSYWPDDRFHPLIRTYLEELGDGDPAQNHVALYERLLARHGCEPVPELSDKHYVQGAIQLALGYHADQFMPELVGYNLGYEMLPLHLLITAFELREHGIDPYYFTLHVTIDNASTGHAQKAVQSVLNILPAEGDPGPILERIANGYRLNDLGVGAGDIIDDFDQEQELVAMLERKSAFGKHLHSDFCSIGGRTVNEWLAQPGRMREFLQALADKGWLKRHQDPENSRFWQQVEGEKAPMLGVFSPIERQLLYDWIAGDWLGDGAQAQPSKTDGGEPKRSKIFRRYRAPGITVTQAQSHSNAIDRDVVELERELGKLPEEERMQRLISLMSPATHTTAAGLLATQRFAKVLG